MVNGKLDNAGETYGTTTNYTKLHIYDFSIIVKKLTEHTNAGFDTLINSEFSE